MREALQGWEDGMCDVYNPAAELPLNVYHIRVGSMPCVPPSDPGSPDPGGLTCWETCPDVCVKK